MFNKLSPGWIIVLFITPAVILGAVVIGFDSIDPAYRTNEYMQATVTKRVYATGKSGARVEITVKTEEGDSFWFNKGVEYPGKVGAKVKVRIYKRKYTGLESFKLES
jgi:hypothetical protein